MQHRISAFSHSFTLRLSNFHYRFYFLLIASIGLVSFTTDKQGSRELQRVIDQLSTDTTIVVSEKNMPALIDTPAQAAEADFSTMEMNAEANAFASGYIARNGHSLLNLQQKASRTLNMYDEVLQTYGVPEELKYLSVIESHLNPGVTSRVGAAGSWQFMPDEARRWGLKVNGFQDERRDLNKSTHAAAKCLKNLYREFGDWLMVLAAYNAGPGKVRSAIRKSGGTTDFWGIQQYLPLETRNHVKKYIAVHYLLEGHGGETTLSSAELSRFTGRMTSGIMSPMPQTGTEKMELQGHYQGQVIARLVQMEETLFNRYNPAFDVAMQRGQSYIMQLPSAQMKIFKEQRQEALSQSVRALMAVR